jgi:hypothetical protein
MPNFLPKAEKHITVYNGDMTKLSPVRSGKARILLNKKKAKIISTNPISIRLNYVKRKTGEIKNV